MAGVCSAPRTSRTVVIGVNWLGDTVMSLPALAALRKWLPQEEIHVVCPTPLSDLVRMAQVADQVWGWPEGNRRRINLLRSIEAGRAILFPNSFRSAWIVMWAGVPKRWGYAGQWRSLMLNPCVPALRRPKGSHHSELYLELLRAMGWSGQAAPVQLRVPEEARKRAFEALGARAFGTRLVGICPGAAYGPAKRWPLERFADAARGLIRSYGVKVVLMGSSAEREELNRMAEDLGQDALNLAGRTDLPGLAALLSQCDLLLCNDSGPMHLAAALGVPVVAVFGSTDPVATAPLGPHRIVSLGLACSPCFRRSCPDGNYRCLLGVQVEDVLNAAQQFLG